MFVSGDDLLALPSIYTSIYTGHIFEMLRLCCEMSEVYSLTHIVWSLKNVSKLQHNLLIFFSSE